MWLFTKRGFYSIVEDKLKAGHWQVRGRVKKDMENLVKTTGYSGPIITTPNADYLYRIVITASELMNIMVTCAKDINYTNFKNECASRRDQDHNYDALHEVWRIMFNVQNENKPKTSHKRKAKTYKGKYGKLHYSNF